MINTLGMLKVNALGIACLEALVEEFNLDTVDDEMSDLVNISVQLTTSRKLLKEALNFAGEVGIEIKDDSMLESDIEVVTLSVKVMDRIFRRAAIPSVDVKPSTATRMFVEFVDMTMDGLAEVMMGNNNETR